MAAEAIGIVGVSQHERNRHISQYDITYILTKGRQKGRPGHAGYNRSRVTDTSIPMSDTAYCYHCGTHHPKAEMRQIETKGGKRWRCIKSIEATKQGRAEREAFGRRTTEINKAEAQSKKARITLAIER